MLRKKQFSLATILTLVAVYAFAFGLAVGISLPTPQMIAAVSVLTLFIAHDLWFRQAEMKAISKFTGWAIFVARYATAISYSIFASFVVFAISLHWQNERTTPNTSFSDALEHAVRLVSIVGVHIELYSVFSMAALISSLLVIRRVRIARLFMLMNLPGVAVFCWCVAVTCIEQWSE